MPSYDEVDDHQRTGTMQLGQRQYDLRRSVAVMAIVNRTPDSFYDRGATFTLDAALGQAATDLDAGADIVDIGGVKAGPGDLVSLHEELDRVIPFVQAFRERFDVPLSVDTSRAAVAEAALAAGANLINDASGMVEPEIADVVADHVGSALVVTHAGGPPRTRPFRPDYEPDVTTAVVQECARLATEAERRGIPRSQIIVDPGHDLHKVTAQSLEITRRLGELAALGYPVLVALSNKDFLGEAIGAPLEERLEASLAAAVVSVLNGARIVRVHETGATVRAVRTVEAILGWHPPAVSLRGLE